MCFSPKIKTPQVNTSSIPEPEPLKEEVKGVEFGGTGSSKKDETDESKGESGRSSLKVTKTKTTTTTTGAKKPSIKSRMGIK